MFCSFLFVQAIYRYLEEHTVLCHFCTLEYHHSSRDWFLCCHRNLFLRCKVTRCHSLTPSLPTRALLALVAPATSMWAPQCQSPLYPCPDAPPSSFSYSLAEALLHHSCNGQNNSHLVKIWLGHYIFCGAYLETSQRPGTRLLRPYRVCHGMYVKINLPPDWASKEYILFAFSVS